MLLGSLNLPEDLKKLNTDDLENLCEEVRQKIVSVCLQNGGHLGASLGAVEIAVAIHRIFNTPQDKVIWDVGHQAYAHKILTGRAEDFSTLRQVKGLSGFLSREESKHDVFGAGHSSTALSAAQGFAYRSTDWTIAVVGDGGLTAGVAFEALNNIQSPNHFGPMLIILNDNQMSISENVGGVHHLLSSGQGAEFFQMFGLEYVGPMNGHDLPTLLATLNGIRTAAPTRPVLLHLMTQKGKGYSPAESRPSLFHGVGPVQASSLTEKTESKSEGSISKSEKGWSEVFGEALISVAEKDPKVLAITAAMSDGTGLVSFSKKFPDRFFDVGIAEPHAVTFAAGLAANGWKPVCAIYSTFLQRGIDAIIHDVSLQKLPVIFAIDRAGLVGADGPTHHGVFDLSYLNMIPGMQIFTPVYAEDVQSCLEQALKAKGPSAIRYPRGKAKSNKQAWAAVRGLENISNQTEVIAISFGPVGARVESVISRLTKTQQGRIAQMQVIQAKPVFEEFVKAIKDAHNVKRLVFFEEGTKQGSLSLEVSSRVANVPATFFSYPDEFVGHGTVSELEQSIDFTDAAFAAELSR